MPMEDVQQGPGQGNSEHPRQREGRASGNKSARAAHKRCISARQRGSRRGASQEQQLAYGLGYFGIALGTAELLWPRGIAKLIGIRPDHRMLIRSFGLREIISGIGILTQGDPKVGMWSRVTGDAVDLACLSAALVAPRADRAKVLAATTAVVGTTVLDVLCALQLSRGSTTQDGVVQVRVSTAIDRSPADLYRFWRNLENLPLFMSHLKSVKSIGENRSHWTVAGPAGTTVEWDAEIVEDSPDRQITWRTLKNADVDHSGCVRFDEAPAGRGTFVSVEMEYRPPAGTLGAGVAALFGEEPAQTVKDDVRRFKQVMEAGEIITTDGQPSGHGQLLAYGR
ncbi:Cyclase/dehydrase [Nitrospira sp. KM1]|uniref:SRPBCC family protein n=1 Tax=Nitrospira sp. KM1 TaxID=1936990 RepID=UPI0013A73DE3|nr:SRPBCC family protein [Nitrospira sp. KM1]BCA56036.1 Cyclase/dehydrase [Nitrospira sp. KM1]